MKHGTKRTILASATAVMTAGLTLAAPSASAHGEDLLPTICGDSSYFIVDDSGGINGKAKRPVDTASGDVWGYVYLLYSTSTGKNCVVTRKTAFHGTPSLTGAILYVEGNSRPFRDDDDYAHYADVQANADGKCVRYNGQIFRPEGQGVAVGGRFTWGNCD